MLNQLIWTNNPFNSVLCREIKNIPSQSHGTLRRVIGFELRVSGLEPQAKLGALNPILEAVISTLLIVVLPFTFGFFPLPSHS